MQLYCNAISLPRKVSVIIGITKRIFIKICSLIFMSKKKYQNMCQCVIKWIWHMRKLYVMVSILLETFIF